MLDLSLRHVHLCFQAGMKLIPKHHLLIHCMCRVGLLGNPRKYTTYRPEHVNGVVAGVARSAHLWTFCRTVHRKLAAADAYGN